MGDRINDAIDSLTQSVDGTLSNKDTSLTSNIADIEERVNKLETRLDLRRARYQAEFLAMERTIGLLQSEGDFLSGQIEGFRNVAAAAAGRQ